MRWHPGPAAPWAASAGHPPRRIDVDSALRAVRAHGPGRPLAPSFPGARPSAVLVALLDGPRGAEVLLTRRAWHLTSHKGEVAFPGGRMDPGETPVATALREAYEEVQLEPALVEVHGELPHLSTVVSLSYIVPVVARLAALPDLRPGTSEVDRIFTVPLADLARADTYRCEVWGDPPLDRPIHFFDLDDETVWGATGRMLVDLLTLAYRSGP